MTYSKFNVVYQLQKWMDSVAGQTFLNYAYSWGAAVVILGTLFKLTHLPGANTFLFLGMGTEVFVFFISAFDRPFDKTTDGMNLETSGRAPVRPSIEDFDLPEGMMQDNSPVNIEEIKQQLDRHSEGINALSQYLPDDENLAELKSKIVALHQMYGQILVKGSSQLSNIDEANNEFKIMVAYLREINNIYKKMIEAVTIEKKD